MPRRPPTQVRRWVAPVYGAVGAALPPWPVGRGVAAVGADGALEPEAPVPSDPLGAAEAAGTYLAQHGPEILRERIVPKFIEAFNDAK